ncbi:MAG: DUF5930 domain-containing protein [Paracoccaceae bacterium]|nr:DUF5930 domain-containing protein [Paracoccaceae bacterium]
MKTRIARRLNHLAEKYFSEQRLYLRSETGTRYMRLTPLTQMALGLAGALLFGWTIFVTSAYMINMLTAESDRAQARLQQLDYETRLNALSAERDQRALEAQQAQERFYVALDQISAQQSALLASEDRRKELETGIDVIQRTLRKTIHERDRAEEQANKLLTELQAATGKLSTRFGETEEIGNTLDYLNRALADTVKQRDEARLAMRKLEERVAELKHKARLMRERNQRIFARLEEAVTLSVKPLKKMFQNIGLSADKLLQDVRRGYSGMGGPLLPAAVSTKSTPEDPLSIRANDLLLKMDKLNMLRIAAERLPLGLPVRNAYRVTSPFGIRVHPVTHKRRMHEGYDMAAPYGTPVYATGEGVVTFAGWAGGYGRLIKIRHSNGFETRYGHLKKIRVKKGQRVSRGQRIGDMGSSGRSTGPHVHYEVRLGGKPVNPLKYIKAARNVF